MKVLLIGGTGTISTEITRLLAKRGHNVYILNRGGKNHRVPDTVKTIITDINNETEAGNAIGNNTFDVVADFIAFEKSQLERDYRLFRNRTKQFIFISTASAYQKPPAGFPITESTPLSNPYWQYSRNKTECEDYLTGLFRNDGFPITIVRPSHTYNEESQVLGGWHILSRIFRQKRVIIPGDGATLWTLTHSKDFALGFVGLTGNPRAMGNAFHITSDEALTWNQIYQTYADALNVPLKAVHISSDFICDAYYTDKRDMRGNLTGDKSNNGVFDNSKIKAAVPGFKAVIPFHQGVLGGVDYFLNNKDLQEGDAVYDEWCDTVIEAQDTALNKVLEFNKTRS